ncbi:Hypothetical_protein [Hexamita inflata]|uniref:Hypothetical_protein n=1 Tax=Hexamita inflata TaxID=28002 RepID=A0AA86RTZ2_9EUKA|nr:Hypothetical protein HINF_LOCUS65514 [Hexamita inflata]
MKKSKNLSRSIFEQKLGQIGCGRQNSASSRIGMAKGMPSTSLQDWKAATAPLLPQKRRWYDAGGFPYRSACTKQPHYAPGCLYPSRRLPWLRRCAQRTVVFKTNDHSRELTVPVQKTELVQTKVK